MTTLGRDQIMTGADSNVVPQLSQDRILIERAKKDPSQFAALYKKYAPQVYNYIWYRIRHNADDAEDLTQEVFARAFRQLPRFQWRGYPYLTYLYRTAHNVLVNYFKLRSHQVEIPDNLEDLEIPYEISHILEDRLALEGLWRAIQRLPEDQKSVMLLYYQTQKELPEIAHILGKSLNATKLLLSRGRKNLKDYLNLHQMARWKDVPKPKTQPRFLVPSK
jgi:RNA polymerase sigma-70 factor (ECF subfamily)